MTSSKPKNAEQINERRRKPIRRKRGKPGPAGPKGDVGVWPAAAYDDLNRQIRTLREDVDDLRAAVAALQEVGFPRFTGRVSYAPSGRGRSGS